MKNKFDEEYTESTASTSIQNQDNALSIRQAEIYRNLESIGPEIAAFYLSGVKVLNDKNLEVAPYLLAHIAREIEGGLRNVLSEEKKEDLKFIIKTPDGNKLTYEKGKEGSFKFAINDPGTVTVTYNRIGKHKASILQSLGIDTPSQLAERWFTVARRFAEFAHRHGAWKPPRSREVFLPLWNEFEDILSDLVGDHFKLLDRIDRLLAYQKPSNEIINTLPNILDNEVKYTYFFNKLDTSNWLEPLNEAGWFHPDRQPNSKENPEQPIHFWHALKYVEKVANHTAESPCKKTITILTDIVNTIVRYTNDTGSSIASDHTESQVIKIISTLPIEKIERQHIEFIGVALKSRLGATLMDSEIGDTFLPKLLNGGAKHLTLALLAEMLNADVIRNDIKPVMDEYWLWNALNKNERAIAEICGIETVQIACNHIRARIDEGVYAFNIISKIDSTPSDYPHRSYAELLVGFTSGLLRYIDFDDSVEEIVKDLLQEGLIATYDEPLKKNARTIFGRIAITAVTHHYKNLKHLFWDWQGNPLENTELKPELYHLLQTHCNTFEESEILRILDWIESAQYNTSADDLEDRSKGIAYRKREWLSALMETGNEEVVSADQKYKQINPRELEHPGLLWWTETRWGEVSPVTVEVLSDMSNARIAEYLLKFKEEYNRLSAPTEHGLAETFQECVKTDPQRFAGELHLFQDVPVVYQNSLLYGFLMAHRDKKEFDWSTLLEFIYQLLSTERFWNDQQENGQLETGRNYRDWVLSTVADLVTDGTKNDGYAFDVQLLPLVEKILLMLVEKVDAEDPVIAYNAGSPTVDLPMTLLNSVKGKTFTAMIDYALRFARTNNAKHGILWPLAIKKVFTNRLDRSIENSINFSFALGAYLPNLLYLDREWVINNIDRIFPQQDENYWQIAFAGYLYYADIYRDLYNLLKTHGHYQKGLKTDFTNAEVQERLVIHVCTGWIEGDEDLNNTDSLIYQLINEGNPNHLSHLVHFFWRQRDNLPEEMKVKVRPAWTALYESLSQRNDIAEYQEVLSRLAGWVALVDKIDAEVLNWVKLSTKYIKGFSDSAFFVEDLLSHVSKTPTEVGIIYIDMLTHNVFPHHDQEQIQEIVRVLYNLEHKEVADRICNLYGEAGFDFLRSLYDENQN